MVFCPWLPFVCACACRRPTARAGLACASVADLGKLAQMLVDLVDRGSGERAAAKASPDVPNKTFIDSLTLLLSAVSMGAYRDGLFALSSNSECPPGLVTFAHRLVAEVTSAMHPAFARQSSDDTAGFAHMLVRYLGRLPPAVGNFSCAPLTPESQ